MVLTAIENLPAEFRLADLERLCPNVTRDMIRVVLNRLKQTGGIKSVGHGPSAVWVKLNDG